MSVHGLTKAFGTTAPTVDQVDLDVVPGDLVALLGPSGCGKTTTLKLIAGLLEPTSGDVRFDRVSVLGVPPERRSVAMVFQKPLLFPHMSVGDNVGFGLRMRGVGHAEVDRRVAEMLELVQLPGMQTRRSSQLSGGQEQRVALARALVIEPDLLLLDEPLSQLDANLRVEMRDLVRSIQRAVAVTTLFVTHDQEEAVVLADRIALMLEGRVRQYDQAEAFYRRPATLAVARFFGSANLFAGVVRDRRFLATFGQVALAEPVPDGPGVLVVRQEAVEVVSEAHPRAFPARVGEAKYLGTHLRVKAQPDGSGDIVHLTVAPDYRLAPGDRIWLHLPPNACHMVPEEEKGPAAGRAAPTEVGSLWR